MCLGCCFGEVVMSWLRIAMLWLVFGIASCGGEGSSVCGGDCSLDVGGDSASGEVNQAGDLGAVPELRGDLEGDVEPLEPPYDYLIVAADGFVPVSGQLAEYRRGMGHSVLVVGVGELVGEVTGDDEAFEIIRDWVRGWYAKRDVGRPFYLVLVGDAVENGFSPALHVPVAYWSGLWQDCYSDNFYADVDDDHVPDMAVGRIPVATVAEFESFMSRLVSYEQETSVGPWNHRFHIYAGEGGFGEEEDKAIELVAQKGLETVPYEFDMLFAYDSPGSKYYYSPFGEVVEKMLSNGAILVSYLGHGGGELDIPDLGSLECTNRLPMCAFFACSSGDYAYKNDSDAEIAFRLPNGPVAMLVSTAVTHPYGNAINALELEAAVFVDRPDTFGEAVRRLKWRSVYATSTLRDLLDSLAVAFISKKEMSDSNIDHQYSYNLLGDPAIRMLLPLQGVELKGPDAVRGAAWQFEGSVESPRNGKADVRIVCGRASVLHKLTPVDEPDELANQGVVQENWQKAMDHVVAEVTVEVVDGRFSGELAVPLSTSAGNYHAYAYVYDKNGRSDAAGSIPLKVRSPAN